MARVTVEDCIQRVNNRFELVMVAAQRSREISAGDEPRLDRDEDKNPVVALREIADEKVSADTLYNSIIQGLQRHVEVDEPEEDGFDAMASNPEFAGIAGQMSEQMAVAAGMGIDDSEEEAEEVKPPSAADHPIVSYEDVAEDDSKG